MRQSLHWDQGSSQAHAAKRASQSLARSTETVPGRASEQVRCKRQQVAHRGKWPGAWRPPASGGCYPEAAASENGWHLARGMRRQHSRELSTNGPQGALQLQERGTEQGKASTFTSGHQPPRQQPCDAIATHGSSTRTWQRRPETKQGQTSPKGYVWSTGPQASWGPGVPMPGCLRQRGSKATARADQPPEWQNLGVLGSPTLAVWRCAHIGPCPY